MQFSSGLKTLRLKAGAYLTLISGDRNKSVPEAETQTLQRSGPGSAGGRTLHALDRSGVPDFHRPQAHCGACHSAVRALPCDLGSGAGGVRAVLP
eukprot:10204147-Alexandrium_andersonii.AAC.1